MKHRRIDARWSALLAHNFVHSLLEIPWVFFHHRIGSVPVLFQCLHEILLLSRSQVQGCGEVLRNDAVRKAKLIKGNSFSVFVILRAAKLSVISNTGNFTRAESILTAAD